MINRRIFTLLFVVALIGSPAALAQDVCDGVSEVNNVELRAVEVGSGLPGRLLFVTAPPGDTDRLFIVDQNGSILVKQRGGQPSDYSIFMDISDRVFSSGFENEAGLLGLAFDPDYATNGFFYVNYNFSTGSFFCSNCQTRVSRFQVSADPNLGDPTSETILMQFPQPQSNHNGGQVFFGPDQMLYVATGDGGGGGDDHGECGNGQILDNLLGKLLRIDVKGLDPLGTSPDTNCMAGYTASTFTVPSDNPFEDGSGGNCDEIYDYGLRNPWRNAFDSATGDLYIADVGQNCWEEVNYVASVDLGGHNYGWRQMEGDQCFNPADPNNCTPNPVACGSSPDCNDPSLTDPVKVIGQSTGACSVTGGYVYRGCRMPGMRGQYFYSDFCQAFFRSFEVQGGVAVNDQDWTAQLGLGTLAMTSFGEDAQGELYIVERTGVLYKLMPPFTDFQVSGPGAADNFLLSRSGNWSWEDLEFSSMHPVDYYQIYRGVPNGTFECIHSTADTTWAAGDSTTPSLGEVLAYVVTAVNAGEETSSGDPERTLTNPCGPPM